MRPTRVLILYNEPVLPGHHPEAESEHEILSTVDAVHRILVEAGFDVSRLGVGSDPAALLAGFSRERPDVVFNLFEGIADEGNSEACVAGFLEWYGVPFTGSPSFTLCLARHKHLTKRLLQGAGLPTPDFLLVEDLPVPACPLEWPVIVKPANQDASVGLDQKSVVTSQEALEERAAYLLRTYGPPVLAEQFIPGREFSVALIEAPDLRALPLSEVLFVDKGPGYWPIITYDAKWKPGSRDYEATPPRYPAEVSPRLTARLQDLGRQAFRLLGCRDYARVDFRVRPSGRPFILEVNPNPDFSPEAGLCGSMASLAVTHAQFTVDLVRTALARGAKPVTVPADRQPEHVVREMRRGDSEAVIRLAESCGVLRPAELTQLRCLLEEVLAEATSGEYHAFVLEQVGRMTGAAIGGAVPTTNKTYALHGIYVAPGWQGQGLGARLLEAILERLRAADVQVLVAEVSSRGTCTQARQFFVRQGFRLTGTVPDFYRPEEARLTYARYLKPVSH